MEEKRRGKRKYVGNYIRDDSGEYVYTGEYYIFDMPQRELAQMRLTYSAIVLAIAAAFLAAGLLNNEGSRIIYVILPFVALFLPIAFMLSDVFRIIAAREGMTRKQYDHSVVQLKHVSIAAAVLSLISSAGDIFFILSGPGAGRFGREAAFLILCVVIFILNIISINVQTRTAQKIRINLNRS